MATRLSDSAALARRCERAGWRVETGGEMSTGGWKVWDAAGKQWNIHQSYSDRNAINHITRDLEKAGLIDAEEAIKKARLDENRTRQKIAVAAAEKRGKELTAKAAIVKAAGPYLVEPEHVDLDWFIGEHPTPWMRWCHVTPKIAQHILDNHNANNRPLDKNVVTHYRNIILAGQWHLTHQGLAFDTRGMCQDGQHRLKALCWAADLDKELDGIPFAVFVGMPPENFKAIDEGKLRSAAQLFGRTGEKNNGTLQTTVRLVHYLGDNDARKSTRLRLPNETIVDEFEADAEHFRKAVQYSHVNAKKVLCAFGALAAAHYVLYRDNGRDNPYVDAFLYGLTEGIVPGSERVMLDELDPRYVLRKRFSDLRLRGERRSVLTQVGMILISWNNCVIGKRPRTLQYGDTNTIPAVLRCKPGMGVAPDVFRKVAV